MRKRRTRQHFIEDLGFNYVEKQALLGNCTMQRITYDYGLDADIRTYADTGEAERGVIFLQIKSTDNIKKLKGSNDFTFDLSKKDLEFWLSEVLPVILILFDAKKDVAYYINLQDYFKRRALLLEKINKFIRVYIPKDNKFTVEAVLKLRDTKNQIYGNFKNL